MGRPNQCNPCCGSVGSTGEPRISDCEKVICVAFIDENSGPRGGSLGGADGGSSFEQRMQLWISAYPNRLLFVLDVQGYGNSMSYPQNFISWPKAFSLRREFDKSYGGNLTRFMLRDMGNIYAAAQNDPWQRIKNIVNHYGGDVLQLFNSSREVAISIDNSGSMTAGQVAATVEKLKQDAINDQKIITQTIINENEDVVCPFVRSGCDTGQYSQELLGLCIAYPGRNGEGVMA
jgi:hypothetical protein